ncbi:hypothetical protein C8Q74DRAFT_1367079 [Fomes fomentarius]|nr:hypothetical protein C8Q74DRAFT_1367079 [Fomes fomentarius]
MSLLQAALRTQTIDSLDKVLATLSGRNSPDDHEEIVKVVNVPSEQSLQVKVRLAASISPSLAHFKANPLQPLPVVKGATTDPLKVLPTNLSRRIFSQLTIKELARCSRVSKKWNKSQTLNYVWFQHYRQANFRDESLPSGKWTKRESKQQWRTTYLRTMPTRSQPQYHRSVTHTPSRSSYITPSPTPREIREEKWREEAEATSKPTKIEMREMYKELRGRKARGKGKLGRTSGMRDRGGWGEPIMDEL